MLWLPVFLAFMVLVADAAFIFFGQNRTYRIVQDANRSLSVGRLASEAEVESYVLDRVTVYSDQATAETTIANGRVTTIVNVPAGDLMATGWFSNLVAVNMTIGASHLVEY